ncbi:DUF6365 family protein [bacterium RCC_150]
MTAQTPVVFFCPGKFSFGELQNAITMARQLPAELPAEFLVSEQYLALVQGSGMSARAIPYGPGGEEAVLALLTGLQPAGVVVADHHLFALERGNLPIEKLLSAGAPVVALDSLCLGPGPSTMRMGLSQRPETKPIHRWFPAEAEVPAVPDGVSLMRPVPVAGLGRPADSFDLYGESLKPHRTRDEIFSRLGISTDRSLVVAARSNWATSAYGLLGRLSKDADSGTYQTLGNQWWVEMFRLARRPITVLELTSGTSITTWSDDVELRRRRYEPIDEFVDILAAADLYITDNLTSGAMAKAAALGTAAVALVNERNERSTDPFSEKWLASMESYFPGFDMDFLVNPFGWTEELAPLLAKNEYLAALPKAEMFNLDSCAAAIQEHLGVESGPVTQALRHQVAGLPRASALLRERLNV